MQRSWTGADVLSERDAGGFTTSLCQADQVAAQYGLVEPGPERGKNAMLKWALIFFRDFPRCRLLRFLGLSLQRQVWRILFSASLSVANVNPAPRTGAGKSHGGRCPQVSRHRRQHAVRSPA
jgi:hypothetical protein